MTLLEAAKRYREAAAWHLKCQLTAADRWLERAPLGAAADPEAERRWVEANKIEAAAYCAHEAARRDLCRVARELKP